MKKYFGMIVLLLMSVTMFGQTEKEYEQYAKLQFKVGKTPVSYNQWAEWYSSTFVSNKESKNVVKNVQTSIPPDSLKLEKWKSEVKPFVEKHKTFCTPGDYLIKTRNQILTGFGIQIVSGGIGYLLMTNTTKQEITINNSEEYISFDNVKAGRTICIIGGLIGLGFEISGIINIGKAGVSLNSNGIGVKVNF